MLAEKSVMLRDLVDLNKVFNFCQLIFFLDKLSAYNINGVTLLLISLDVKKV